MNPAKNIAKTVAKQIAQEPLEILKTAKEQVTPTQNYREEKKEQPDNDNQAKELEEKKDSQDKMMASRRREALERELEDIKKEKLFADLQRRIANGEEVFLEEYPTLSVEQKQVLMAQMEAVKNRVEMQKNQGQNTFTEPAAKKGRQLFNFGKKTAMQREQTRVEKPVPPSG
jgi:hypothetical protein